MTLVRLPRSPQLIDFDLMQTGRLVSAEKADLIGDLCNHQHGWRRRMGHCCVLQRDVANTTRGAPPHGPDDEFTFFHPTSQSCSHLYVSLVTQGATGKSPTGRLRVLTTTDAVGVLANEVVDRNAPAGDTQIRGTEHHEVIIAVTPGTEETVRVVQESSTAVRILGINVQELPIIRLNTAVHTGVYDKTVNSGGGNIADDKYDDLALAVQRVRTKHKKVLASHAKLLSTDSATFVDLVSKSLADRVRWAHHMSPWLPETADPAVSVAIRIWAQSIGGSGSIVRFAFASGNVDITLTNTTLQLWTATGTINTGSERVSVQAHIDAAAGGTRVDVYTWRVAEGEETA